MSTKRKEKDDSAASVHLDLNKRTKQEWIEGAAALKHERFEVAGALFNCKPDELLSQQDVQSRLDAYLRPAAKKEETLNVNSES
ncbi:MULTISPECIES: hypothetical protein [Paenibacillus]|uniref:hypothetical protein n=1 Tax=Paenibacillus TaxID=44249 RepID=UPI00240DF9DD|nr:MULTISPECIES: hypothetical protein [Paenibacillus]MCI1776574.1 hypothetical protein [Paenibacillus lautus]WFB57597.1 hypothetical protein P0X86_27120 [Paenibacillus sp. BR1-192]